MQPEGGIFKTKDNNGIKTGEARLGGAALRERTDDNKNKNDNNKEKGKG